MNDLYSMVSLLVGMFTLGVIFMLVSKFFSPDSDIREMLEGFGIAVFFIVFALIVAVLFLAIAISFGHWLLSFIVV